MEQVDSMESVGHFLERWSGWAPILLFALLGVLEVGVGRGATGSSPLKRIWTNVGLYVVAALVTFTIPLTIAGAAAWAGDNGIGLFNVVSVPALPVLAMA